MKIRWRLTWYGIGFTALSLLAIIALLVVLVTGTAQQDQDEVLADLATDTATSLATIGTDDLEPVQPPVAIDATSSDQPFVTVYLADGSVLYTTGTVSGEPVALPPSVMRTTLDEGAADATLVDVRMHVVPWESPGVATGFVGAMQTTRVVTTQSESARSFLIVFGLVALFAAAIGAWLMAGRALGPLRRLVSTTDDIGRTGDLSRRLPPSTEDDEVGALTGSFNAMLEGIESARADREATIESQRTFIADASHELRSPLTSIRANAGFLIDRRDADQADRDEAIADIAAEADRMSDLVDELLTLARADAKAGRGYVHTRVDVVDVASAVMRRVRNLDTAVTLDAPAPAWVDGDVDDLTELLWILIDNADRHGGDAATVSVASEGGEVRIVVADNGDGIPIDDRDKVFERFHRSDGARTGTGYGLGLSIARSIVERHNGSIEAANGPSGGAAFDVRLPAAV